MGEHKLSEELAALLNRHCIENESNSPDFILAEYMESCLHAFEKATQRRDAWYGVKLEPGQIRPAAAEEIEQLRQERDAALARGGK